ncbi:hypothetical protein [Neolewinella litorea]|uniref:Uncharacterized protein n=1 Tax=Neolewinella litorea TaxID=2562452 RepID=A0A4S4NLY9_9BACT|nr:hypothetical protein [Neolewinella litorea]THH39371.1 hypothetical protein E4021_11495 [Neolewinella litorea]
MKHQRITELLDRYFAGETTLEEERALKKYFRGSHVAEDLKVYAPLFAYWDREASIAAPARVGTLRPRRLPRLLLTLAAALLLLLVARGLVLKPSPTPTAFPVAEAAPVDWSRHEITDEKEALLFLRTVLKSTSRQLTQGPAITLRELREADQIIH